MIRQAEMADFGAITHIRESTALEVSRIQDPEYRVEIERRGFLLPSGLSVEDFQTSIASYDVAEREGQVIGYVRLTEEQDMLPSTKAFWYRPDIKDVYYANPHAYIWGIGVLPEASHHGVGTEMLQAAERQVQAKNIPWLFSEIVIAPVTNIASMLFHEKNGFERIALQEPTQAHGMEGFQNLVYGKPLP